MRRKDHVLHLFPLVVKGHVEHFLVGAVDRIAVERHNLDVLPVGVLVPRLFEFFFFGGEVLDDFVDGSSLGQGFVERPFLRACDLGYQNRSRQDDRQHDREQETQQRG